MTENDNKMSANETGNRRAKTRILALLVGGLAALSLAGAAVSMAQFTDQTTVPANSFTTGTVEISTTPASALVTFGNMAPGDKVTNGLAVNNDGTLAMRYSMTTSSTDPDALQLRTQLTLEVRTLGTSCAVFDGAVVSAAAPLSAGASFGNIAQGPDPGDRNLAAGTSETLCFRVSLPLSTGNAYQGAATVATFTFNAEQTKNNP